LLLAGVFFSAFFSGSETGFYRVTRVRLVLDALDGDPISRGLLWLTNNPALFVATTLIGNNMANYATSLAIVVAIQGLSLGELVLAEVIAPVALSPLVFVYAELLPKNLFFHAPNRLLRRGGPLFLLCVVLFWPASALLWALGRLLQGLLGEAPLRVKLTLARAELREVLQEGQEAGILRPAQRHLAQSLIAVASRPVSGICTPVGRIASVRLGAKKSEVLRLARRHGSPIALVTEPKGRNLAGYVRIVDLYLDDADTVDTARPLTTVPRHISHIEALIRMQSEKESLARVVDDQGQTVGLLYANQLAEPLFRAV
jgi:CBS domain containing-hemolysin-like protein